MEEKKLKNIKWFVAGLFLIAIIVGCVYTLDSKSVAKSSVQTTDPETGLKMWIKAVNLKNTDSLYDLVPDEIKQQMTSAQFKEYNVNNTILKPGSSLPGYNIIDKKQNGTYAQIVAKVLLLQPGMGGNSSPEIVPLSYQFDLYYEHGEWKIWTDSETGLQMWIDAFNSRDIDRIYDLAPDEIKQHVTLAQFKEENINNTYLQPGNSFTGYTLLDKRQNATYAQIITATRLQRSASQGNSSLETSIEYKFALYYEHGEWKIWTLNFM